MKKKGLLDFYKMKERGEKVAWITAYDAPTASFAEAVGMDMLLVGDSLGMCVLGLSGTVPVTMEESLHHTRAVRTGAAVVSPYSLPQVSSPRGLFPAAKAVDCVAT